MDEKDIKEFIKQVVCILSEEKIEKDKYRIQDENSLREVIELFECKFGKKTELDENTIIELITHFKEIEGYNNEYETITYSMKDGKNNYTKFLTVDQSAFYKRNGIKDNKKPIIKDVFEYYGLDIDFIAFNKDDEGKEHLIYQIPKVSEDILKIMIKNFSFNEIKRKKETDIDLNSYKKYNKRLYELIDELPPRMKRRIKSSDTYRYNKELEYLLEMLLDRVNLVLDKYLKYLNSNNIEECISNLKSLVAQLDDIVVDFVKDKVELNEEEQENLELLRDDDYKEDTPYLLETVLKECFLETIEENIMILYTLKEYNIPVEEAEKKLELIRESKESIVGTENYKNYESENLIELKEMLQAENNTTNTTNNNSDYNQSNKQSNQSIESYSNKYRDLSVEEIDKRIKSSQIMENYYTGKKYHFNKSYGNDIKLDYFNDFENVIRSNIIYEISLDDILSNGFKKAYENRWNEVLENYFNEEYKFLEEQGKYTQIKDLERVFRELLPKMRDAIYEDVFVYLKIANYDEYKKLFDEEYEDELNIISLQISIFERVSVILDYYKDKIDFETGDEDPDDELEEKLKKLYENQNEKTYKNLNLLIARLFINNIYEEKNKMSEEKINLKEFLENKIKEYIINLLDDSYNKKPKPYKRYNKYYCKFLNKLNR